MSRIYRTDEDLEERVHTFLKKVGLARQTRPDLMTVITKIKHIDPAFNYARIPDHKMPDAEAQWDSKNSVLRMRETVFIGMQRGEARARMSVAHELAHYIFGHKGLDVPGIDGVLNRSAEGRKPISEVLVASIRQQESEARRAGPVILAPEHLVPDQVTVEALVLDFGLSTEAAIYRREEVEAIRRRRRGEKRPLPRSVVDYLREAKRRGYSVKTPVGD